jgi:hypothetical protein
MQLADQDGHMAIALHWASHDNLVEKFNITGYAQSTRNQLFIRELCPSV